ncbi:MAG: hypothetical protein IJY25_06485 [Bacilli bacterium]|nr:hypothetical protein [Bacilli bacterium]
MTNKEIDKLLNMLDKKELDSIKKYLLSERKRNNNIQRQRTFEKYLTTNIDGLNDLTLPIIYPDHKIQIFSNGASIYIINKNFLNLTSINLSAEKNKKRTTAHRYKLVSKEEINELIQKLENMLGNYYFDILSMECGCNFNNKNYDIEYYDELYKKIMSDKFSKKEIDTADILLDNPNYTIYSKVPIIKGESDIGKVYILGHKRI